MIVRSGFSYGVSFDPITKSPDGTTTSSGQSEQSRKVSPGSRAASRCATTASDGDAGRSADGPVLSPRCAFATVAANPTRAVREITDNRRNFMSLFPRRPHRAPKNMHCHNPMSRTMLYLTAIGKVRQPAPICWSRGMDFGLHRTANEYRLPNCLALAAVTPRRVNLFHSSAAQVAVHYSGRSAMIQRILTSILVSLFGFFMLSETALSQTGGPTPSPAGAAEYFIGLKDGDTIPTKVTLHFGLRGMGVAPAGSDRANSGHHHLIVDAPTPSLNSEIPERLPASAFRRRTDRNRDHADAGRAYACSSCSATRITFRIRRR